MYNLLYIMSKMIERFENEWKQEWFNNIFNIFDKDIKHWEEDEFYHQGYNSDGSVEITDASDEFYKRLSSSPNITWDIIINNLDKKWDWYYIFSHNTNLVLTNEIINNDKLKDIINKNWIFISYNKSLSLEIINNNLDKNLSWFGISQNPNINIDFIKKHYSNFSNKEYWYYISMNPNIKWKDVVDNKDFLWDWRGLTKNPNITWYIIRNNLDKKWDWDVISRYKILSYDTVLKNPSCPWNYSYITMNENIEFKQIHKNIKINWFNVARYNKNIKWDDVKDFINNVHDLWWDLSISDFMTWDIIINNLDKNLNWYHISNKDYITIDIIKKYPNLPWSWYQLTKHKNITFEMILENPNLRWDWTSLGSNPNISFDIIKKYPDVEWSLTHITHIVDNHMAKDKDNYVRKRIVENTFQKMAFPKDLENVICSYF